MSILKFVVLLISKYIRSHITIQKAMSVTREKIMELGENLMRTRGYNAFSYQDISSELGVKNAAIHYYFPSKENLGTAIVKNNKLRFEDMVDNMRRRNFNEWQQLVAFLKIYVKSGREHKLCIVGSLAPEYNTLNESMRLELKNMSQFIMDWLTNILDTGRTNGLFAYKGEPQDRAMLIFTSLIASMQLMRIFGKSDFKPVYQSILAELAP